VIRLDFIVIFGTDWKERPAKRGSTVSYFCPSCGVDRSFDEWETNKVFSLYWMPLFVVERGPHFWRCSQCQNRYAIPEGWADGTSATSG